MKVVIAADAFKDCLSSEEVNEAVRGSIFKIDPEVEVVTAGISDGALDGLDVLKRWGREIEEIPFKTTDLMGRPVDAPYLTTNYKKAPLAIIATASTAGKHRILPSPGSFIRATSFGLGTQIRDALGRGAKRILILTGETGVSDGGLGLLQALGVNFYDEEGHLIGRDKNLLATNFKEVRNLESVIQQFNHVEIMIATNTDRPYAGYRGAQRTWGMDKGGTKKQIEIFDKRMDGFFMTVIKELNLDLRDVAGLGVDGGIGGALAVLGGQIVPTGDIMANLVGLPQKLEDADLFITGTGKISHHPQTPHVINQVLDLATKMSVPAVAICGQVDNSMRHYPNEKVAVFSIQRRPSSLRRSMETRYAIVNIKIVTRNIIRLMNMARAEK